MINPTENFIKASQSDIVQPNAWSCRQPATANFKSQKPLEKRALTARVQWFVGRLSSDRKRPAQVPGTLILKWR